MNMKTKIAVTKETDNQHITPEIYQASSINQEPNTILSLIERVVTAPNVDIQKIQQLLEMQMAVQAKNAENAFYQALANMQNEIPNIPKDAVMKVYSQKTNKSFEVPYASFENIHKHVTPKLQKWGFAIFFQLHTVDTFIKVTGNLTHKSGHRIETEIHLPRDNSGSKNDVQSIGSSISYGKRYVICSLLNIATEKEEETYLSNSNQPVIDKYLIRIKNANAREDLDHIWQLASQETLDLNDLAANNEIKAALLQRKKEIQGQEEGIKGAKDDSN